MKVKREKYYNFDLKQNHTFGKKGLHLNLVIYASNNRILQIDLKCNIRYLITLRS